MDDADILERIAALVEQEHTLERSHAETGLAGDDLDRLRRIEVALDQCWDLLRQRRARRDAGQDPGAATTRSETTVEGYKQ